MFTSKFGIENYPYSLLLVCKGLKWLSCADGQTTVNMSKCCSGNGTSRLSEPHWGFIEMHLSKVFDHVLSRKS